GEKTVTEADLKEMSNAVPDKFKFYYQTPEGRRQTLEYIVNVYALAAEAEKQGVDKRPDVQKLLNFTRNDLLARFYLEGLTKDLPTPTDAEAKAFYEGNKAEFVTPESIHLSHILVESEKDAKDVLARLKKGEKFGDIASQVSVCPSKDVKGDLDWMPRGSLAPEIEDVAFTLKNDQIQGPVKTKFGYHVLLMHDKRPARENSYDQVKDMIMEQLKFLKQQEQYEKIAEALRKKYNVQILLPAGPVNPSAPR
ncbi:MAG: peptidylprolyl isomerase, partial [Syntrophaceae bacterium]|nr:peptidylprolyl isomerase [Syntrophaceae bacterium]